MVKISEIIPSSKKDLISFAEDRIFSLGSRDLGSALSYKNMRYGLGKMIYALEDEDLHCVLAPDASITRNKGRWLSGFGYGGVIRWSDPKVAFPETRPNACGMLFMRVDELPDKDKLVERASEVNGTDLTLEGVEINPDFGKGNHFFEFYEPREIMEDSKFLSPDSYFAILHCSAPEIKDEVYSFVDEGKRV